MCVYIYTHTHHITHVYFMLLCTTGGITMFKALSWRLEGRCLRPNTAQNFVWAQRSQLFILNFSVFLIMKVKWIKVHIICAYYRKV